ncbi:MAG: hypothetical protein MN733_42815, partial [Nitrososphaera sp.]|nr:hypothetical protein [Nitrososphaera sp.]
GRRPSERPPAAPRRAGRPRSQGATQGACVKRTLRVESVRSASETLVWSRLCTDRAHNNRKAGERPEKTSNLQIPAKAESSLDSGSRRACPE